MTKPRDRRTSASSLLLPLVLPLLLAACGSGPTSTPTTPPSSPVPTSSATESIPPATPATPIPTVEETGPPAAACTAADLKVSHGLVEGAAGSRDTEVVLVTAVPCALAAWPAFGLRDARGGALVAGVAGGSGAIVVRPGDTYISDVRFANWCGAEPAYPLSLELRLAGETVEVGDGPFPEDGDMPPCTDGDSPELNATAWGPPA